MRISDWSSDVCSSDLKLSLSIKAKEVDEEKQAMKQYGSSDSGASLGDILGAAIREKQQEIQESGGSGAEPEAAGEESGDDRDRKSVVEGKSVSGRVDLGGRRIIKKKKPTEKYK